jgi:uncharacterized protein
MSTGRERAELGWRTGGFVAGEAADAPILKYSSVKCSSASYGVTMVSKPDRIFGRDREWRSLANFAGDDRPEATLGVVSGRRRQGKTFLLRALAEETGGFFFEAVQATEAESLRMLGADLAKHAGAPAPFSFATWEEALDSLFSLGSGAPVTVIIDEFPYLADASPSLP